MKGTHYREVVSVCPSVFSCSGLHNCIIYCKRLYNFRNIHDWIKISGTGRLYKLYIKCTSVLKMNVKSLRIHILTFNKSVTSEMYV